MIDLFNLSKAELKSLIAGMSEPTYRADQLWQWIYQHLADDFESMSNLPRSLRETLVEQAELNLPRPLITRHSGDGQTKKVLFQMDDGQLIETVLMRYEKRRTLCISTQAGCAMGCVFCATGQMGFIRNLTVAEIVKQVIYFAKELEVEDQRVTNIVMMGMGEPLHNYDNTLAAVDILTDGDGLNLGARKITISTVGLVPAIRRYADEGRQTPLAISLHAATDEERDRLIPLNRRWPISEVMAAGRYYIAKTGRRLTIEWALIKGENDTVEQARILGRLLEGMLCHVNLIPLNPTKGYQGKPSSPERVRAFQDELARHGIGSTVRVRRGIDIQAGCGQLRTQVET